MASFLCMDCGQTFEGEWFHGTVLADPDHPENVGKPSAIGVPPHCPNNPEPWSPYNAHSVVAERRSGWRRMLDKLGLRKVREQESFHPRGGPQ